MREYLPQKGKIREKSEGRKAWVIFTDFSLLRQIFPPIQPQADEMNSMY